MRSLLSTALVLLTATVVQAADSTVELVKKKDTVEVTIGGKLFTVYNTSKELPKPFFDPVYGLAESTLAGTGQIAGRQEGDEVVWRAAKWVQSIGRVQDEAEREEGRGAKWVAGVVGCGRATAVAVRTEGLTRQTT